MFKFSKGPIVCFVCFVVFFVVFFWGDVGGGGGSALFSKKTSAVQLYPSLYKMGARSRNHAGRVAPLFFAAHQVPKSKLKDLKACCYSCIRSGTPKKMFLATSRI